LDTRQDITHPDYWYNRDKYVVVGFSRCGQTALSNYLRCGHPEIGYNGTEEYLKNYSQCTPVFITRDPVDRIWSLYNFFAYFNDYGFEEFLDFKDDKWNAVGCNDVIAQSDYDKYIEPFEAYGAEVYRFEYMIKKDGFKDWRGKSNKKMPMTYRIAVEGRLKEAGISY